MAYISVTPFRMLAKTLGRLGGVQYVAARLFISLSPVATRAWRHRRRSRHRLLAVRQNGIGCGGVSSTRIRRKSAGK